MASVLGICGGLAGPKSGNVEKPQVFVCFFDVFKNRGCLQERFQPSESERFDVKKVIFVIKNALWLYSELCFLCRRGAHFQKNHENKLPESETWSQHNVGYIKNPLTWGRIHEDGINIMSDTSLKSPKESTCSNNTHICKFFEAQLVRHGGDKKGKERTIERRGRTSLPTWVLPWLLRGRKS